MTSLVTDTTLLVLFILQSAEALCLFGDMLLPFWSTINAMNICNICQRYPTSGNSADICSSRWVCLYVLIPSVCFFAPWILFQEIFMELYRSKLLAKIMQRLYCSESLKQVFCCDVTRNYIDCQWVSCHSHYSVPLLSTQNRYTVWVVTRRFSHFESSREVLSSSELRDQFHSALLKLDDLACVKRQRVMPAEL